MAFERLKINKKPAGASPSKMGGGGILGMLVGKKGKSSLTNAKPPLGGSGSTPNLPPRGPSRPPAQWTNTLPPFNNGGRGQEGSGSPPPSANPTNPNSLTRPLAKDPAAKTPAKKNYGPLMKEMQRHIKNGAGIMSIMDWLTVGKVPGNGGWGKPALLDPSGESWGGKDKKPKPPVTPPAPTPQWTFTPSPFDQSPYAPVNPGPGPASQYTVNPPAQPWMFNPAAGGQGQQQAPQWYGQQAYPNAPPYQY